MPAPKPRKPKPGAAISGPSWGPSFENRASKSVASGISRIARHHHQLRGVAGERLPGHDRTVIHGGVDLVAELARREIAGDRPEQRPEEIRRRHAMPTEMRRELLAIAQFHFHA